MATRIATTIVTIAHLRELWTYGGRIEREGYPTITQDDLSALASQIDTDDDGMPATGGDWAALVEQINSDIHQAEASALVAALDIPGGPNLWAESSDLPDWSRVGHIAQYGAIPDTGDREYRAPSGTVYSTHDHDPQRPARVADHIRVIPTRAPDGDLVDVCYVAPNSLLALYRDADPKRAETVAADRRALIAEALYAKLGTDPAVAAVVGGVAQGVHAKRRRAAEVRADPERLASALADGPIDTTTGS